MRTCARAIELLSREGSLKLDQKKMN